MHPIPGAKLPTHTFCVPDPFSSHEIDIAQLCSPPFIWLAEKNPSSVELFPIVPIFKDERTGHKPVCFSDVIVAANSSLKSFDELKNKTFRIGHMGDLTIDDLIVLTEAMERILKLN